MTGTDTNTLTAVFLDKVLEIWKAKVMSAKKMLITAEIIAISHAPL